MNVVVLDGADGFNTPVLRGWRCRPRLSFELRAQFMRQATQDIDAILAPRAEYLQILKSDPAPDPNSAAPVLRVQSLTIAGDTAIATIERTMVGTIFTSHLSMLRTEDGWQIVNGLFHANPISESPKP